MDISYSFYLANIIRTPSYVALGLALHYYNLATEAIHSITSITPKVTREYQTKSGQLLISFNQKRSFSDFSLVNGKFDFYISSPSKALFDLLYFRTNQFRGVSLENIKLLVEELRIDIDEMDKTEQKKFYENTKKFI